ncbi:MAG: hypothetical protein ABIR24_10865 [Verrucomicrobiota bacterium]
MSFNGARYFMRREDYAPRKTPDESPFRNFHIRCLRCDSYKLQLAVQYDESEGVEIFNPPLQTMSPSGKGGGVN